ncbi:MAG: ANTAR domain-containing protein [Clostridiales bacterium]|nr:ANTAR domain-containing protein [Clostridiales bacterium]
MQKENAYSVLLVSSNAKFNSSLTSFMPPDRFDPIVNCESVSSARRVFSERNLDIVIINTPLKDEIGINFAIELASESTCGVMLLVKSELFDDVFDKVQDSGVFVVPKPVTTGVMSHSLKMLCSTRERLLRMEQKQKTFEEKINEIKTVNRAKLLLMENLAMSEEEAHKFIEKSAMNERKNRLEISEQIIEKYKVTKR